MANVCCVADVADATSTGRPVARARAAASSTGRTACFGTAGAATAGAAGVTRIPIPAPATAAVTTMDSPLRARAAVNPALGMVIPPLR
ncbi:hypothetical protein GCM10009827_057760 [Dactylosporangium maewongense]|uniref:Uncharacterized protein n=1 Tax=Dactylosporangium maewongense TaxID=634393 RepID=A0ABN2B2C1_9ACTN